MGAAFFFVVDVAVQRSADLKAEHRVYFVQAHLYIHAAVVYIGICIRTYILEK